MFSNPEKNLAYLDVGPGMSVADIGAGSGFYIPEIHKKIGPTGRIYAIDVQKDLLDRLKKTSNASGIGNVEVIWANAEKIGGTKLRESSVDRVVASNIFSQLEKIDDFVLEMKRILKNGGKIMLVDWPNLVAKDSMKKVFEKMHFSLEKEFDAGDTHYGFIFKKS